MFIAPVHLASLSSTSVLEYHVYIMFKCVRITQECTSELKSVTFFMYAVKKEMREREVRPLFTAAISIATFVNGNMKSCLHPIFIYRASVTLVGAVYVS